MYQEACGGEEGGDGMSNQHDRLEAALHHAVNALKMTKPPKCHHVEFESGVAVFRGENDEFLGAMNAADYLALKVEMARK